MHQRLSFHLSGAQLGLTVVSLVLGFVAEPTIAQAVEPALDGFLSDRTARGVSVAIALGLATFLIGDHCEYCRRAIDRLVHQPTLGRGIDGTRRGCACP